jgi:hypothetical protein
MSGPSEYERLQIEFLLHQAAVPVERNLALHLMPQTPLCRFVFESAVIPAMQKNGLNVEEMAVQFDSDSALADAVGWMARAEVIVADVSDWFSDIAYLLGVCHALGRCPILIGRGRVELPFNLQALRFVEYKPTTEGYVAFRDELTRALRIFLTAARATGCPDQPPAV